ATFTPRATPAAASWTTGRRSTTRPSCASCWTSSTRGTSGRSSSPRATRWRACARRYGCATCKREPSSTGLFGAELHFGRDNPGDQLDELPLAVGALELPLRQLVNFREQLAQAGPELVAFGRRLNVIRVHLGRFASRATAVEGTGPQPPLSKRAAALRASPTPRDCGPFPERNCP